MFQILGIDTKICTECGQCVKECSMHLFIVGEDDIYFEDPAFNCIQCGHCVAVCPVNAILMEANEPSLEFPKPLGSNGGIESQALEVFLRSRRSVRRYKQDSIPEDTIEAILRLMSFAPSAHNNQAWEFLVLTNRVKIQRLVWITHSYVKSLKRKIDMGRLFKWFLPRQIRDLVTDQAIHDGLEEILTLIEAGEDPIFHNAPVVIVVHAQAFSTERMAGNDAGCCLMHGMLGAHALGLGTCWIGFAQEALNENKHAKEEFGIPAHSDITGVLVLGMPAVNFHRAPPRKTPKIRWS